MFDTFRRLTALSVALPVLATAQHAAAQERLDLTGGFQPDPVPAAYTVTGTEEAGGWVRGCPGFVAAAPAVTVGLADPTTPLHLYLVGEGARGMVVADPEGIHHCETLDIYGIAHLRVGRALAGDYLVWPIAAEAGSSAAGTILVSEGDLGPRDVAAVTGLRVDPSLLPPLLSEVPLTPGAEPAFGRVVLPAAGTAEAAVTLAGRVPADEAGPGCTGLIDQTRPDVVVSLPAPEPLLAISAAAAVDTTLIVLGPDGAITCNDDAGSYDPAVVLGDAVAGDYAVWVGAYPGGAGQPAVLRAGREPPAGAPLPPAPLRLATEAEPAAGRHALPPGGSVQVELTLAGGASASEVGPGCGGEIDPGRPDAIVTLPAPEAAVWFGAASTGADTTILVVAPDGSVLCNDDHDGMNAAVAAGGAGPGEYAIWVGSYPGQAGQPATLTVAREEPAAGGMTPGGMPGIGMVNPFAGVPLESAAQALDVLVTSLGLDEVMSYERLEETGPEGIVLHGVTLTDPSGAAAPVRIGRIRIGELDLAGLSAGGMPERFALAIEGIDYAALAAEAETNGMMLPAVEGPAGMSVSLSLLPPDGDATRREARFALGLDGQISVGMAARVLWPEGAAAMGPMVAAMVLQGEAVEFDMHDMGFGAAMLDRMAAESGKTREALIAETLAGLATEIGPMPPGSPQARFYETVSARLGDIDRPGRISLRFRAAQPVDIAVLMDQIGAGPVDGSGIEVEIAYTPDP